MSTNRIGRVVAAGMLTGVGALAGAAQADEVAEGTVLSAANLDQVKEQTLDGKRIGDMLVGEQEKMIRQFGWTMKLMKAKADFPYAPNIKELTEKFKGQASLDGGKHLVNYTAGMPFPELSPSDPDAGIKLAYNILRPGWAGNAIDLAPAYFVVINGEKGIEREQRWHYRRFIMSGRTTEPYVMRKDITKYEGLVNQYPQDTRGVGLLTVNYADGRLPDVYVYVKAFRRVRRLSSSVWADPVQATDFLFDETFGLHLAPTWYQAWNLKEKKVALVTRHAISPPISDPNAPPEKKYSFLHLDQKPYWNFTEAYEPAEVWYLEAVPKSDHLVSKRHSFIGADPCLPMMYWQDLYDRKGEHWRTLYVGYRPGKWADGSDAPMAGLVSIMDLQRMHATVFGTSDGFRINPPDANVNDYTPEAMPRMLD
jgi:hypothetical protein